MSEGKERMHVVVNELSTFRAKTGIGHYTAQLLRCLHALAPDDVIESYPGPWFWKTAALVKGLRRGGAKKNGRRRSTPPSGGWRAWLGLQARSLGRSLLALEFRRRFRRGTCDLYHEPNLIPMPADVPTAATLHDLSVLLHPEWHPADRVARFERGFRKGLAQCRHFFAISESARQELIRVLGLRPEQVTRTYMGVRPGLGPLPGSEVRATLKRLGLPPRYFLHLGTIEPRKNLLTLLRAYVGLPAAVRERYPLVLAGGWGWNVRETADFLDREGRHRGVLHAGYLPDGDAAAVYNGARALAFPSFYEGFGLPPVEMLACGGAVLCSTADALVETVGRQAHLIEPLDVDGWRAALLRAAVDDDWVAGLRRGAEDVARPFTWEKCAADTRQGYRFVCGRATPAEAAAPLRQAG